MSSLEAFGKSLMAAVGANDEETGPKHWLDMGYKPLNKILSGDYDRGFAHGRMIEIYGPSAAGKTLLATMAMIAAQKAGGIAIFVDWERAFNVKFAVEMGLNPEFPHFIYKRADTWESGNTLAMQVAEKVRGSKAIPLEAPIVAVFDSIAAAVPKSVMYDSKGVKRGISELTMNDTTALARVTSTTLKSVNQYVGDFDMTAIYLNQIRTKPGVVYGDPTTTPGGGSMEFYASTRLALGAKRIMEKDSSGDKEFKGRLIGMQTKKNKLSRPFQSVDLRLVYDEDGKAHFDFITGMLEHLIDIGQIKKEGARVTFEGKSVYLSVLARELEAADRLGELEAMLPRDAAGPEAVAKAA